MFIRKPLSRRANDTARAAVNVNSATAASSKPAGFMRRRLGKPQTKGSAAKFTAAPRGPLLDASAGQMRGGLVAELSGGGLPTLRLDAPDWRMAGGALNARLALAGDHIDYAPLEGVAGRVEGVAQMAGPRFSFALAGCQPLTATRVLIGETPLSAPKVTVCPGAGPLLTLNDGAWTASARFSDLTTALDEAQVGVEDGAGGLTASGAGGAMRAEVRLDKSVLRDGAETRRFNPIKAAGRLSLSNGLWTGAIDATTPVGQPLGRIVLRHDVAQARGRAEIDASKLAFVKDGLQPGDLCLILIDQVEEALAHIAQRIGEAN